MTEQSEIVDLSSLSNFEIMQAVQKLLEESQFSKFTVILTRKTVQKDPMAATGQHRKRKTRFSISGNPRYSQYNNSRYTINKEEIDIGQEFVDDFHVALGLYNRGLFQNALEIFTEEEKRVASNLKESVTGDKQYQSICFYLGNCFYRLKKYQKAIQYYTKKFEGEELKQQGQKFNNLGSCYAHLDQLRLSLNYYAQAYRIYQQFPQIDCSNLLNNIGMLYAQSSMYETAEKYFLQSIEQRKLKSPESGFLLYCSYQQLGNCQKQAQKYNQAIASLFNALKLAERGIGDQSQTLTQLASIYEVSEKWSQALDCYEKLSLKSTKKGFLYEKAAQLHRNMGNMSDYDRFIKKAYEEYRGERNDRKLSELLPVMSRLNKK